MIVNLKTLRKTNENPPIFKRISSNQLYHSKEEIQDNVSFGIFLVPYPKVSFDQGQMIDIFEGSGK